MFNPLKMAGDMKGMEKMLKPALEKFMQESGFVKQSELRKLEKRVEELRSKIKRLISYSHNRIDALYRLRL
jgi:polyhydroxyalkanoate synthesis regulator phasin